MSVSTSAILNEFKSTKNKSILWNFMIENKLFEGIDNKYSNDAKLFFENKIVQLSTNISPIDNLVILNKQIISEMITNNLKYKDKQYNDIPQASVTANDITEQRQKVFNKVFENKQSEFNSLMNKNAPNKIDFSDNTDKPIGSEMDRMLAETIAWREKQLNVVLETNNNQKEASSWINRDKSNEESLPIKPIKLIKIGSDTTLGNIVDIKRNKNVSFNLSLTEPQSIDNIDTDNFLSMLKKTDDNVTIKSMLTEVLNNQKIILNLLQTNI
jgi:hypothetical protein